MSDGIFRVMYFSDAPYFGGAEKYLELLISGLRRDRFEPCVVIRKGAALADFAEWLARTGVSIVETRLSHPYDIRGYWDFFGIVRKWKPDILHINLPGTYDAQASLVAPVAWSAGCRCIVTTEHLAMVQKLWKRNLAKRLSAFFIQRVISVTHSNVRFLTEVHGINASRIVVIHNGVNMAELDDVDSPSIRTALGLDDSVFLFAAVGSLIERKGYHFLLEALARLCVSDRRPSALLIVGEGTQEGLLKRKSCELGVDGRVFFLGHRTDAQGIMREIDCLVLPSLTESMPFVILEAMVASKAVIASRIYGIPEVVVEGETGFLVPPADVASLSFAMRKVMESPGLAESMGVRGRQRVREHFSYERMVREVENVYEAVLS